MLRNNFRIWYVGGEDVHMRIPLLNALRKRGFNVGTLGSENGAAFKEHGIEYYRYPLNRSLHPLSDLKSIYALIKLFRKHKVDIVHAFDTKPALFVPIAGFLTGVPVVMRTIAGMGYVFSTKELLALTLKPIYRLFQKIISLLTDMTVFQNQDDSNYFLAHGMVEKDRQQIVLSSGIDLTFFDSKGVEFQRLPGLRDELGISQKVVIILVSRLVRYKGIVEYMDAARMIRKEYPNTVFLLVGPRESEGKQAVPAGLIEQYSDDILYLGKRNDIRELLAISDIFVLPSYYREGVPRVLLEAGAMGLPLVTTDMPGCRDVVRDSWNGLLVPPRDIKALAGSIAWLIRNKDQRKLMGERNKSYIRMNFNLDLVADAYAELYRKLLEKKCTKQLLDE